MLNILFPSYITNNDVVDGSLKSEYEAAVATGFDVAIFDNGEWFDNDRLILKNEFRVFYANGEVVSVSRNSGQPNYSNTVPSTKIYKHRHLNSNYYTVDYAELIDGRFVVIEVGDGQVSGLSDNQDYVNYFRTLYHIFN